MAKLEAKPKKSSSKKLDHDLISGRLNLREQIDKKRNGITSGTKSIRKEVSHPIQGTKSKGNQKPSNLKSDDDLGRLNFRKHAVTELEKLRAERKEYETEIPRTI